MLLLFIPMLNIRKICRKSSHFIIDRFALIIQVVVIKVLMHVLLDFGSYKYFRNSNSINRWNVFVTGVDILSYKNTDRISLFGKNLSGYLINNNKITMF